MADYLTSSRLLSLKGDFIQNLLALIDNILSGCPLPKLNAFNPMHHVGVSLCIVLHLVERVLFDSGETDVVQSLKRVLFRYLA